MANAQNKNIVPLGNWSLGGLADSRWSGQKNTSAALVGIDLHSIPGLISARQKLKKDSGSTVTEFCKYQVPCSNGDTYHFSSETGKIWKRTAAGVWSLVYTIALAGGEGEVKILGAKEYDGYIYVATEKYLHRIAVANLADWNANMVLKWGTFLAGDNEYHPMYIHSNQAILYIGDGRYVAQVNSDTDVFTNNALDVKAPQRVTCFGWISNDVLVGTKISDTVNHGEFYRWNGSAVTWTSSGVTDEGGINAIIPSTNFVLVQAGLAGSFYYYNGESLLPYKKIPGVYSQTAYMKMYPDASANFFGQLLCGISNGAGNPCKQGVYNFGRYAGNYPTVLDLSFPLSMRDTVGEGEAAVQELAFTGIEIGSIIVSGFNVFVSWKRTVGAVVTTGIDMIDWSNKIEYAYIDTRVMVIRRNVKSNYNNFNVAYVEIPSGTSIKILTKANYAADFTDQNAGKDDINKLFVVPKVIPANTMEKRIKLVTSGNSSPLVESAAVGVK